MKKLILSLTLLITISTFAFGQVPPPASEPTPFFQGGIRAGMNLTKISGLSFDQSYRVNYLFGGYACLNLGGLFGLQPELLLSQISTTTGTGFTDLYSNIGTIDLGRPHLDYLSIPILLNFGGDQIKFQLGPQFGILTNSNESFWTNGRQAFTNENYAFDLGVWINLPLRLSVSVRYVIGLTDINNINNLDNWKTQELQIGVGFRL
jgi:hypothetical protein